MEEPGDEGGRFRGWAIADRKNPVIVGDHFK